MKKLFLPLLGMLCVFNVAACAGSTGSRPLLDTSIIENVQETFPTLNAAQFGDPIAVESEDQMFALSEQQRSHFLRYYHSRIRAEESGHERVYRYLQDIGSRFTYEDQTNNAETTLRTESGNCMSLAVLTTALARLVDVEIKYELVNRVPIYQEYGSVVFNAQHIRSVIYAPLNEIGTGVSLWRNKAIIDYYPSPYSYASGVVSIERFVGMYYQNLAAEALGKNDYQSSFWLLMQSLNVDVDNAEAINSMAILNRRIGDEGSAEALYKYGIKHAENKVTLLKNYHVLLKLQHREADAQRVAKELEGLEDLNPFRWLHAANEALEESDYTTALKLYQKAIKVAPYLHQGYFGIAKVEYMRGNLSAANSALKHAHEVAADQKSISLYEAKLAALSKQRFN